MIAPLSNVTLLPARNDMRSIYGKCRILLVPSLWEEAYGRVAVEAQISGIPVVASNRGGLPEAVGGGGILVNPESPISEWVSAVRELWDDERYYDALSAAALVHAAGPELVHSYQIKTFEHALTKAIGTGVVSSPTGTAVPIAQSVRVRS